MNSKTVNLKEIRKPVLRIILSWLQGEITEEDKKWVREQKEHLVKPDLLNDPIEIIFGIHEELVKRIKYLLDIKARRGESLGLPFENDQMPRQYLLQMANMLNLTVSEDAPNLNILKIILSKIEENKKSGSQKILLQNRYFIISNS